jgi:hypothetical protein
MMDGTPDEWHAHRATLLQLAVAVAESMLL